METEIFKEIEGYPGYLISNLGNVVSLKRKSGPHCMSQHKTKYGYIETMVSKEGVLVSLYVARQVLAAFKGYPADPWLCIANHKDGDSTNCRLDNLEWIVCETTDEYDPSVSHRRGVLKPDLTRKKMTEAKCNQSPETIEKAVRSRMITRGFNVR